MKRTVRTTCPYCGVGCGVLVEGDGQRWTVRGDPDHPANRGRLCTKGAALAETLGPEGRLLQPEVDGRPVGWDEALERVASGLAETIARHGPDAVAFYVSGQLLTEDYYLANKLMKGFIGSANIDTNSRLCMASPTVAHQRAFGEDLVPVTYEDLDAAELVVMAGWNGAHTHPVLFGRIRNGACQGRLVVIDPRRTASAQAADLHLAIAPGSDIWLWNGLLEFLKREDALDWAFLEAHVSGFAEALAAVRGLSIPEVARRCGVDEAQVAAFYRLFRAHSRVVTVFSQGVNQSVRGSDGGNAIINVHLATGRIGKPGAGPFAVTGQPNAMGGREVGGLATQLAAHRDFSPESRRLVQAFWRSPRIAERPGLKAVDLFEAVHDGRIKAIWIMATNPVVSLPDADRVRQALSRCPLVIVSDMVADTDTLRLAHVKLPAAGWGEKDGTVTNSERRISRQRAFLAPPGQARPDTWIIGEVARRMGFGAAFDHAGPHAVFAEHVALTRVASDGPWLRLDAFAHLTQADYDALEPTLWPSPGRLFADGRFATPDGRARMVAVTPGEPRPAADLPLLLNTGRLRDQWHTMTRTGRVPRLFTEVPEPFVAMNPGDAKALGLKAGDWAWVDSPRGRIAARVWADAGQRPGEVFVPIHWNGLFAHSARVGTLIPPARDPHSGQPAFKATPVRVEPIAAGWQALLLSRQPVAPPPNCLWHRVPLAEGTRLELLGLDHTAPPEAALRALIDGPGEWLRLADPALGRLRLARIEAGRLAGLVFLEGPKGRLPERAWLDTLLARPRLEDAERAAILAGRAPAGPPPARLVCACKGVDEAAVAAAIAAGATTVEDLAQACGAGTGCGSCLPELEALLPKRAAA